jgi:hypothetical protein
LKKRKLKISPVITILGLTACFFAACSERPSYVLSESKMEDVLYDLYLAEVAIEENRFSSSSDSALKQDLLNSIFKRHKVTEQKFDTSLFWYNANIERYLKINTKVGERFAALSEKLKTDLDKIEAEVRKAQIRNLFPDTAFFFLESPGLYQNRYVFKSDSAHLRDIRSFYLAFQALGIRDSIYPALSFCLQVGDTVFVNRDTIRSNGSYSRFFRVPSGHSVQEIYGVFSIPDEGKNRILFNDIILFDGNKMPE